MILKKTVTASVATVAVATAWLRKLRPGIRRKKTAAEQGGQPHAASSRLRVLEVHPRYCWSFDAESEEALASLRVAVSAADATGQSTPLHERKLGHAYKIFGSPVTLDLAEKFFDRVILRFEPTPAERLILDQKRPRWLKSGERHHTGRRPSPTPARDRLRATERNEFAAFA